MGDRTLKDDVISRLTDGIARLTTSERWHEWLTVQSQFHQYSFGNALLIQLQSPSAIRVGSFRAWRRLGRNVRKGERAIWILAPVTRKAADVTDIDDASSTDTRSRVLVGFKPAAVFDIAQTDGAELPEVCNRLDGEDANSVYGRLLAFASAIGYSVEDATFIDSRNGDCAYAERRIRIAADRAPVQRVKTLAHELAHAMLHEGFGDRALAELEAESVAFIVCEAVGVDSAEYSLGYVSVWAGGGDKAIAAIRAAGNRIQRTANEIVGRLRTAAAADVDA